MTWVSRCWPASLTNRLLMILAGGLVVLQIGNIGFFSHDRMLSQTAVAAAGVLDRVESAVQLIRDFPEDQHSKIIGIIQSPLFSVVQTQQKPSLITAEWRHAQTLHESLRKQRLPYTYIKEYWFVDDLTAISTPFEHLNDSVHFFRRHNIVIPVQLAADKWLIFRATLNVTQARFKFHAAIVLLIMTVATIAVIALLMRQMTRPLRVFADAAQRLGKDINTAPLEEKGGRELRHAAAAFNTMQQRLQRLIDDRTHMIAAISHDLRTYLTRLKLRAEFIEDGGQRAKALRDIDEMQTMLASTMTFAKNDFMSEAVQQTDLGALLKTLCDDYADAHYDVTYQQDKNISIAARPVAIKRALSNIIDNAVKYGLRARVSLTHDDGGARITIQDDGPGISQQEMENVYRPFYRIETSRNRDTGGIGLGLTLAHSIIHAHGGRLNLHNRDPGLSVTISLPCK